MLAMKKFANAALPWAAMGLLVAILAARNATRKNKGEKPLGITAARECAWEGKTAHRRNICECHYL